MAIQGSVVVVWELRQASDICTCCFAPHFGHVIMAVLRIVFSPHSCSSVQMTWFTCTRRMKQSHHPPTFQKSKFVKELIDKLE